MDASTAMTSEIVLVLEVGAESEEPPSRHER
jgi:hypothetical protein